MNSYHVFVLSVGKEGVERVHVPDTGQTREEAEKTLKRSQRSRIIGYRLARPTSHYREGIEERERRPKPDFTTETRTRRFRYR